MNTPTSNDPAFPAMHLDLGDDEHGLTIRDYFAARAMQGFASDPNFVPESLQEMAELSYKWADAMCAVR